MRQSRTVSTPSIPPISSTPPTAFGTTCDEEVRHRRDVAVDALDQLARRVGAVELVVEAEDVAGHPQPQLVGGAPRRDRRVAGDDDADHLRRRRRWRGTPGRAPTNVAVRRPSVAWSTIAPHDERAGQRQRRAGAEERAEDGPTPGVGPEQGDQGAPARRRSVGTGASLPPERPFAPRLGFARPSAGVARGRRRSTLVGHGAGHRHARGTASRPTSSSRRSCWSRRSRSTGCAASTDVAPT